MSKEGITVKIRKYLKKIIMRIPHIKTSGMQKSNNKNLQNIAKTICCGTFRALIACIIKKATLKN